MTHCEMLFVLSVFAGLKLSNLFYFVLFCQCVVIWTRVFFVAVAKCQYDKSVFCRCFCFFSQITMLINNAGVVSGRALLDTPDELIERSFNVNVLAHFWVMQFKYTIPNLTLCFKCKEK